MKQLLILLAFIFSFQISKCQINIVGNTNATPALLGSYSSMNDLCNALNVRTLTGAVTVNIDSGYIEQVPYGGLKLGSAILNPSLNSINKITIQKNGSGTNPKLYAYVGGIATPSSSTPDCIFIINGSDYITIDGIDLQDTNSINPATMELGYALFKLNNNDGCKNITIKNCVVNLKRINNDLGSLPMVDGSVGIGMFNSSYNTATTALIPTAVSGSNSNNRFIGNSISNCNIGVAIVGYLAVSPYTLADQNNYIGDTLLGNTIKNFGGGGNTNPSVGIRTYGQYNCFIRNNIIDNNDGGGVNHANILRGIYTTNATNATVNILYNTISLKGGGNIHQLTPIENTGGATPNSNSVNINYNMIQNCSYVTATSGVFYGIYNTANPTILNINNNIFTNNATSATSGSHFCIYNIGNASLAINMNNNFFNGITSNLSSSTSFRIIHNAGGLSSTTFNSNNNIFQNVNFNQLNTGLFSPMYLVGTCGTMNASANNFYNLNINNSGLQYLIFASNPTANINITNNFITGQYVKLSGSTNSFYGIYLASTSVAGKKIISGNNLSNMTINNTSGLFYGIYVSTGQTGITQKIFNNTINNFNSPGAGTMYGVFFDNGAIDSIYDNNISGFTNSGAIYGMLCGGSSVLNAQVYKNKISDLLSNGNTSIVYGMSLVCSNVATSYSAFRNSICNILSNGTSGQVQGLNINGGALFNVFNNTITALRAEGSANSNALTGINAVAGTNINLYYNTVYLSGSSYVNGFGSSAILMGTGPTNIDVRNNIFINNTEPTGSGFAVGHKRNSISLVNYASTSSNNIWYAKTYFFDGTNSDNNFTAYQNRAAGRDSFSFNQLLVFSDTICGSPNILKVDTSIANAIESKAQNLSNIISDFNYDSVRFSFPISGQINGGGLAPDIGAHEQDAMPIGLCSNIDSTLVTGASAICSGQSTILHLSILPTTLGVRYQWKVSTSPSGTYTNLGVDSIQNTGTLTATRYYYCEIKCLYSGAVFNTPIYTLVVNLLPNVTVSSIPSNSVICTIGSVTLNAVGANTYVWSPSASLSSSVGNSVVASPSTTTTYTVIATDINGCSVIKLKSVLVDLTPPLTGFATASNLCAGASTTISLFDTTYGILSQPVGYCVSQPTSASDEEIYSITFNGVTNAYNCTTLAPGLGSILNRYSNFTNTLLTTVASGTSIPFTIVENECNGAPFYEFGTGIWIDFNRDGDFDDAGEEVFKENSISVGPRNITGNITIPTLASAGYTRMRITVAEDIAGTFLTPCMSYGYGETEDYLIHIINLYPVSASNIVWSPTTFLSPTTGYDVTASNVTSSITYTVTATSVLGCTKTKTFAITAGLPLSCNAISSSAGNRICIGNSSLLKAMPNGGGMPYSYLWSNGSTDSNITVSPSTTTGYTVTINDACGQSCSQMFTIIVDTLPAVTINASPTNAIYCNNSPVMLQSFGASSYSWLPNTGLNNNNTNLVLASPFNNTTYTVTGIDAFGCTGTATKYVINDSFKSNLIANISSICLGGFVNLSMWDTILQMGSLSIASGYCTPTVASPGASGDFINNFTFAGINNTTGDAITDYTNYTSPVASVKIGNTYTASISTNNIFNAAKAMWIDYNKDGDFNDSYECVSLSPTADKLVHNFSLSIPMTAISGRTKIRIASKYNDTMNATNSCSHNTFGEYEDYLVDILGYVPSQSYVYNWSPASSLSSSSNANVVASPASTTTYTVTSTSPLGCINSLTKTITVSTFPIVDTVTHISCSGANNGIIKVDYFGGVSPYVATINPISGSIASSSTSSTFSNLAPQSYTVTVSDFNSCVATKVITLTQPSVLNNSFFVLNNLCFSDSSGLIVAQPSGGTIPYSYNWLGQNIFSDSLKNILAGTYSVNITDANGCNNTFVATLTEPIAVNIDSMITTSILCNGDSSAVSIYTNDSISNFTFSLNSNVMPSNIFNVAAGVYTVTIFNASGCMDSAILSVSQPPALSISITNSSISCYGDSSTVTVNAIGGVSPYMNTGSFTLPANTYTFTVADNNGCSSSSILALYEPNQIAVDGITNAYNLYAGDTLILDVVAPNLNYTYSWLGPNSYSSSSINNSFVVDVNNSGSYLVFATDTLGCNAIDTVMVTVSPAVYINLKVFLSGCFVAASNLMHDSLRNFSLIPTTEPYSSVVYSSVFPQTNSGGDTTTAMVLSVTGNDAIVDWVFLELHHAINPLNIIATKPALLQRDGDVVATDGKSAIRFNNINIGNYYVAIRHRNHLGIMTKFPISLSVAPSFIDFTDIATPLYRKQGVPVNNAFIYSSTQDSCTRITLNNKRALYAGNCAISMAGNIHHIIRYNGNGTDRLVLYALTGMTGTISGYLKEDINMDGKARFNGFNNDRAVILENMGLNQNYVIYEQLPY